MNETWRCCKVAVIINSFRLPKDVQALTIDSDKPKHNFNAYKIADELFDIVPVYDSNRVIAIQDSRDFVGKTVEFVMV